MPRVSLSIWARERAGKQTDKSMVAGNQGHMDRTWSEEAEQMVKGLCTRDPEAVGGTEGF